MTRLKCGGFILALRFNHTMSDGYGMIQFMMAMGDFARGARSPSILPVWQRYLLNARDPPRVTCEHHAYDEVADTKGSINIPLENMAHRSFFFGPTEVSSLRRFVPHRLSQCSMFELLTACLWRCHTIAIQPDRNEEVRILCLINARPRFNRLLPIGYYGNAFAISAAVTTTQKLCENSLGYALELVKKAKNEVTKEYMQSLADLMVIRGRPNFTTVRSYVVSDVTHVGLREVDFGWGQATYGGPAKGGLSFFPGVSFYIPSKNGLGEDGIIVPIYLPTPAMERFVKELDGLLRDKTIVSSL